MCEFLDCNKTIYAKKLCYKHYRKTYLDEWYSLYRVGRREMTNQAKRSSDALLRSLVIELYGKKCVRCGYLDQRVLQLDHINGNGRQERKAIYNHVYRNAYLEFDLSKYQLLCANCNWLKFVTKY